MLGSRAERGFTAHAERRAVLLGRLRTGAFAVATPDFAQSDPCPPCLLGTGTQAREALDSTLAVPPLESV